MSTQGGKTGCVERPDNFLEPVKTYFDALRQIRPDDDKLLVSGIWTQPNIDTAKGGTVGIVGGPLTSDLKRDPACKMPRTRPSSVSRSSACRSLRRCTV